MNFLVDCIAISIQCYLLARMVSEHFPVKEPKEKSFKLVFLQMWTGCIASTVIFVNGSPLQKILSGVLVYIIFGLFVYKGKLILKIGLSFLLYAILLMLDFMLQFIMFGEFIEVVKTMPPFEMNLLARLLGTPMVFLICLGVEFLMSRQKGLVITALTGLGVAMALIQWMIIDILFTANSAGMIQDCVVMSFIFSSVLMGGYIVVTEMFRIKMRQQEKEIELEQIRLKTRYQYDLYQQALEQGEQLRNLRHDMRNQLQTMQYLVGTKGKDGKDHALQMLDEMKNRMK